MKHLKLSIVLLLTVVFFTSCEKETFEVTEVNEVSAKETVSAREEVQPSNVQFFFNEEESICSNLPIEDFSEANHDYSPVASPLSEYSSNSMFSTGEIQHGVSFETPSGDDYDFYLNTDYQSHFKVLLVMNGNNSDLHINFSVNVLNVTMNVYNWQWNQFTDIDVYGNSGLLGSSSVYPDSSGSFVGISSFEHITSIVLKNYNPGVDNISFGICPDLDNDGVLNEDDAHIYSNMSEEISFGGCYPDVANAVLSNGSTMADEIDDLVAEIWEKLNSGNISRYYNVQKDFQRQMTNLLAKWYRTDRVITDREKSKIVRCVRSSRIFEVN